MISQMAAVLQSNLMRQERGRTIALTESQKPLGESW
jgi:hypothetical protein